MSGSSQPRPGCQKRVATLRANTTEQSVSSRMEGSLRETSQCYTGWGRPCALGVERLGSGGRTERVQTLLWTLLELIETHQRWRGYPVSGSPWTRIWTRLGPSGFSRLRPDMFVDQRKRFLLETRTAPCGPASNEEGWWRSDETKTGLRPKFDRPTAHIRGRMRFRTPRVQVRCPRHRVSV